MSAEPSIGLLSPCARLIIAMLEIGLYDGDHMRIAIHASKKGLRLTLRGRTFISGKTPHEFCEAYKAASTGAKKGGR